MPHISSFTCKISKKDASLSFSFTLVFDFLLVHHIKSIEMCGCKREKLKESETCHPHI